VAAESQDPYVEASGRVNQKRRTRAAIVAAARAILDRGETPTVAQVAEEAQMTRTTVYRYFPDQESLLVELSVSIGVDEDFAELLARPLDGVTPQTRLLEVIDALNSYVAANEKLYRTAQRHYLDTWLAAERAGPRDGPQVRQGRRLRWISATLAPLRETMPDADFQRLEAALCLVTGGEAFTVLRDICGLEADEAMAVAHWAAQALLTAGLHKQPSRGGDGLKNPPRRR
jgi:AcrR family transcriptional regulator